MRTKNIIKAGFLIVFMCGAASAATQEQGSCGRWIGFNLDDSMDFEIIVHYTHCDGRPEVTAPFGRQAANVPLPLITAFNSELTIYWKDDLTTPLLSTNTGTNPDEGMIIECSTEQEIQCVVNRP